MRPVQECRRVLRHLLLRETLLPQLQKSFLIVQLLACDSGKGVSDGAVRSPGSRLATRGFLDVFANAVGWIHDPTCLVAIATLGVEVGKVLFLQVADLTSPHQVDVPVAVHLVLQVLRLFANAVLVHHEFALAALEPDIVVGEFVPVADGTAVEHGKVDLVESVGRKRVLVELLHFLGFLESLLSSKVLI